MSGVSSAEFLLLLVIGLIVLGPKRLPEIANKIGGFVGQARRMTRVMKRQLEEELSLDQSPTIRPPDMARRSAPAATPDRADPAYDTDDLDEPVPHVPKDDDTYSPLHGEDDEGAAKTEPNA
ncbi:MAG: twin-arginine translocase TatA/TatE family subunit [Gammaproteobacteria bacterium]|nr:twin-arginine translocase TatA/TatE family subunit [Gammaproteobacteria bacterium]